MRAFAAHYSCILLILFGAAGVQISFALVRHPDVLLTGFNHDIGPVLTSLALAAALIIGAAVLRASRRRRLVWRLFWAVAVAFAVLGFFVLSMFLGRDTWMIAGLLGWSLASSAVSFLVIWGLRAVVALWRSNLTQLMTALRRGMDGGLIAVALSWTAALFGGGNLFRLIALNGFYALLVPTMLGFGMAVLRPARPSGWFALASLGLATCIAVYSVPWPFVRRHEIDCQWWYPAGRHDVFGFHDEPWHWHANGILTWVTAPGVLGELTVRNIAQPLTELICAAPDDDAPWRNYGM